jgi:hypothetical protein
VTVSITGVLLPEKVVEVDTVDVKSAVVTPAVNDAG